VPNDADFRSEPPTTAGERELLQGFLDYHRGTLLWKIAGLTGEQLVQPNVEPSKMSLIGLVRHVTEVERFWFQICLDERPIEPVWWTNEHPDGDFDLVDPTTAEQDVAQYREIIKLSDEIGAKYDLDHICHRPHPRESERYSVRWLYLHMVEEYARHNGHADFLRERIDGETGE
jgi:uncharacterized damage-inducible protein DinB